MRRTAENKASTQSAGRQGKNLPAALCSVIGTLILLCVIIACLPVPLAHMAGYEVYNVVSGSMEPAIPVGSAIYVRAVNPADLVPGDIIAFRSNGTVVTHRVVENRAIESEIVTKGDANEREDMNPVRYSEVVGRVTRHIPRLGGLLSIYTGGVGRIYALCLAAAGALLNLVAGRLRRAQNGKEKPEAAEETAETAPDSNRKKKKLGKRTILMLLLAVVFVGSVAAAVLVYFQGKEEQNTYLDAAQQYVSDSKTAASGEAPITVDFDALCAVNGDIVGWLYCEGTPLNYPVLQCGDNDTYLRHDYLHNYSVAGSIFVEAQNRPGFVDANIIIYGHHMADDSMFATLELWQEQSYYEAHPEIWLLTPEQNYRIVLFSGYSTDAYSETYAVFTGSCAELNDYLQKAAEQSAFASGISPTGAEQYVVLSTCAKAYGGGEARQVLHGILVPEAES